MLNMSPQMESSLSLYWKYRFTSFSCFLIKSISLDEEATLGRLRKLKKTKSVILWKLRFFTRQSIIRHRLIHCHYRDGASRTLNCSISGCYGPSVSKKLYLLTRTSCPHRLLWRWNEDVGIESDPGLKFLLWIRLLLLYLVGDPVSGGWSHSERRRSLSLS